MILFHTELPIATGIAALAAIAFLIARARQRERQFSLLDSLMLVILMSIATAGGITLVEAASEGAKETALRQNLQALRIQIEIYRFQHNGQFPVLFEGGFPQLTEATDVMGVPGLPDSRHPYGPYLRIGIPVNPITGRSAVTATTVFPPRSTSGNGGWLYHQKTGRITADTLEFLNE